MVRGWGGVGGGSKDLKESGLAAAKLDPATLRAPGAGEASALSGERASNGHSRSGPGDSVGFARKEPAHIPSRQSGKEPEAGTEHPRRWPAGDAST